MEFLLGILSGVITTFGFWAYKAHISPPDITFGNNISKRTYDDGTVGFIYIYKNTGERRIIDVSIKTVIKIPELTKYNPSLRQVLTFDTENQDRPVIEVGRPRANQLIVNMDSLKKNKDLVASLNKGKGSVLTFQHLYCS